MTPTSTWALLALLLLPGAASAQHEHAGAPERSEAVRAALQAAVAALPPPDYAALVETRRAAVAKADAGSVVQLEGALAMSVVVVLDEAGKTHSECVESGPPPVGPDPLP